MARKATNRKDGRREPNGRLSRAQEQMDIRMRDRFKDLERDERDTMAPGIEARQRVHGLPFDQASQPMASTFVGRLCMGKELSRIQYEAAMLYIEDCTNYARAVHAPRQPGAVDLNATKGGNGDYENVQATQRAKARYTAAQKAVQEAQNQLGLRAHLFGALYEIVQMDRETYHLVNDCKLALNALGRHYGLLARAREAA